METLRKSPGMEKAQIFSLSRFQRIILRVSATSQVHFPPFPCQVLCGEIVGLELTSSSQCKILQLLLNFLFCFHPLLLVSVEAGAISLYQKSDCLLGLGPFGNSVVLPMKVKTWSGLSGPTSLLASYLQLHLLSPYSPCTKLTHTLDVCGAANQHCCSPFLDCVFLRYVLHLGASIHSVRLSPLFKNFFSLTSNFNFLLFYNEHLCYDLSGQVWALARGGLIVVSLD